MDRRLARTLAVSLVLSLAIHGIVLTPPPGPPSAATHGVPAALPVPSIINARLAAPARPIETAAPAERKMASRSAGPLRPGGRTPRGAREIAPPPPPPATGGKQAFRRASAAAGAPASTAVPAEAAPHPPEESPGPDPGGLRQYRLALGRAAGAFRNYPPEARQAGLEGRVLLHLAVSAAGIPGVSLARSSGHPALDEAASDMVLRAAERTILPDSLRGRAFATDLAVEYLAGEAGDEP